MKLVTLIIIILSSLLASAQGVKINIPDSIQNLTPQNPKIEFKEQEYDFGSFEPVGNDTLKSHSFRFYNTGQQPLVILHVASSCGCTRPQYSKTPIEPGDSGIVTVNYKGVWSTCWTIPQIHNGVFKRPSLIYTHLYSWRIEEIRSGGGFITAKYGIKKHNY